MTFKVSVGVRLALVGGLALSIAACASQPKPAPLAPTNQGQQEQGQPYAPPPSRGRSPNSPARRSPARRRTSSSTSAIASTSTSTSSPSAPTAMDTLAKQAQWLNRYPAVQVRIEGNCDERGTEEYNFGLGARRAESVKEFLINHGVDGSRITTVSYGKARPIDPGDNDDAWAKNRNAHTAITVGAQ